MAVKYGMFSQDRLQTADVLEEDGVLLLRPDPQAALGLGGRLEAEKGQTLLKAILSRL